MKLFRRRVEPAEPSPAVREAVAELRALAHDRPTLAAHAQLVAEALPVIFGAPVAGCAAALTQERIAAKWAAGTPLLRGAEVLLDAKALAERWQLLASVVAKHQGGGTARPAITAEQIHSLLHWFLVGDATAVHGELTRLGLEPDPAGTILQWTVLPTLIHLRDSLTPLLPATTWLHGHCPLCGSWPALGEFRGLEQVRYLRCGWCAMSWEFPRLKCPYCGNDDHRRLEYLHEEGREKNGRIATCDACRGYVKMVAALTALSPPKLLAAEVATLPLDLVAAERGYAMP